MNPEEREKVKQEILTDLRFGPVSIDDIMGQCRRAWEHDKADVKLILLSLKDAGQVVSRRHFNKDGQRWVFILAGGALA